MNNFLEAFKKQLQENGPVLLLASVIIFYFYGPFILHPQSFLLNGTGDGLKNYYTYAWYIQNNTLSNEFTGMNYPFGEHIFYTDCHPLPAFLLKLLCYIHPIFAENCIGILNWTLLTTPILTALIVFRIFRNLHIEISLATASAVGIMMLSPQTFRLTGHWALSYSFCIPTTIYLLLKHFKSPNKHIAYIFIFLNALFWLSIHAYLGIFAVLLTTGFGILYWFDLEKRKLSLKLLLSGALAFMCFYVYLKITDNHVGRTTNPWGIYELHASFSSVFIPKRGPIAELVKSIIPTINPSIEGISYIGIVSLFTCFGLLFYVLKRIIRYKKQPIKPWINNAFVNYLIIIGVFSLLFSMLFPFWWKLEKLLEYLQFVKQFRAVGRFAWIFYFIIAIVATFKIQEYIMRIHPPFWVSKMLVPIVFLAIPLAESVEYHKEIQNSAAEFNNVFDAKQLSKEIQSSLASINQIKYQAIIPLPYYYIGSDNFGKTANDSIYKLSKTFSFHLELPIMASFLSRTSISESKKMMQITGLNYYPKLIEANIVDPRPFLLVANKTGVTIDELKIISRANLILNSDSYSIYEISKDSLFHDERESAWNRITNQKENLAKPNETIYENFENETFTGMLSNSAKQIDGGVYSIIHTLKNNQFKKDEEYVLSMWMNNFGPNNGQDQLSGYCFIEKNYNGEKSWITGIISPNQSSNIFNNWSFVEVHFWGQEPDATYDIMFKRDGFINLPVEIDHLLVRPANKDYRNIFNWGKDSILHYNGHLIVKPR